MKDNFKFKQFKFRSFHIIYRLDYERIMRNIISKKKEEMIKSLYSTQFKLLFELKKRRKTS